MRGVESEREGVGRKEMVDEERVVNMVLEHEVRGGEKL